MREILRQQYLSIGLSSMPVGKVAQFSLCTDLTQSGLKPYSRGI
ncbi:hypothetical protein QUA40_20985 [Microcoleus sp. Pol11C3]